MRRQKEECREWRGEIERRDMEMQQQEKFERCRNRGGIYSIRVLRVPRYLRKKGKERRMIRVARFKLGSEMRGGRYWEKEEKRKCRLCGWAEETWEHVEMCIRKEGEGGRERIVEILEDGRREC